MKRCFFIGLLFCLPLLLPAQEVITLKIDGPISPASADFIQRGIEKAQAENAVCLIIQLNTPGGLITSTLLNLLVLPTLAVKFGRFSAEKVN